MTERQCLKSWLQSQHLEGPALERLRAAFTSHPARLVVIEDFLAPEVADRLNKFLTTEAEFQAEHGRYSTDGAVSADDWRSAEKPTGFSDCGS